MLAEIYVDSILELLKVFAVKRYCLLGSVYDMVPYTRPLLVTSTASTQHLQDELDAAGVVFSHYEGPTTILQSLGQKAVQHGLETLSLIVHIPSYLSFEEDYRGVARLMEVLAAMYGLVIPETDADKAREQEQQVGRLAEQIMQQEPKYRLVLHQLEANYDARVGEREEIRLSPEIESFLQELNNRFKQE
jgi:predicted ATP-grasp superfamily ATP-dependent carboligase